MPKKSVLRSSFTANALKRALCTSLWVLILWRKTCVRYRATWNHVIWEWKPTRCTWACQLDWICAFRVLNDTKSAVVLINDYVSTNEAIANKINIVVAIHRKHRFNSAILNVITVLSKVVSKLDVIKSMFWSSIPAAHSRNLTPLSSTFNKNTRWRSNYSMVLRFIDIFSFLSQPATNHVAKLMLSNGVRTCVVKLLLVLIELGSVEKRLQLTKLFNANVSIFLLRSNNIILRSKTAFSYCANYISCRFWACSCQNTAWHGQNVDK